MKHSFQDNFYQQVNKITERNKNIEIREAIVLYLAFDENILLPIKSALSIASSFVKKYKQNIDNPSRTAEERKQNKQQLFSWLENIILHEHKKNAYHTRTILKFNKKENKMQAVSKIQIVEEKEFFLVEKDTRNLYYDVYKVSPSKKKSESMILATPKIPGVKIKSKKEIISDRIEEIVQNKKDIEPPKRDPLFENIDARTLPKDSISIKKEKTYLGIPKSYYPEKQGWQGLDAGKFISTVTLSSQLSTMIHAAKSLGAKYDTFEGLYYIPPEKDTSPFNDFLPENIESKFFGKVDSGTIQDIASRIRIDLIKGGLDPRGEQIYIDNAYHNIWIKGDSSSNKPGTYRAAIEGDKVVLMFFSWKHGGKDNKTFIKYDIQSRSKTIDPQMATIQKYIFATTIKARSLNGEEGNISLMEEYQNNALIAESIYKKAIPAVVSHPYLRKKQIDDTYLLRMTKPRKGHYNNGTLIIPLSTPTGKIMSIQNIPAEGKKWIGLKDRKDRAGNKKKRPTMSKGCMHIISRMPTSIKDMENPIVIVEGFATGATIEKVLERPVVMAISAYTLKRVISEILNVYPDKKFVIAADNDLGENISTPKTNVGLEKAIQASIDIGQDIVKVAECTLTDMERKRGAKDFNDIYVLAADKEEAKTRIKNMIQPKIDEFKPLNAPSIKKKRSP